MGCGPVNGILSGESSYLTFRIVLTGVILGEKARDVFVKSKLPVDKLSQIW